MRSRYFTFLYNECKRSTTQHVDSEQINLFINSPEGQLGFKRFCARQVQATEKPRPKSAGQILSEYEHE